MRSWIIISLLAIAGLFAADQIAAQQSGGGFYEKIRYRDNDPMLFCTEGPSIQMREIRAPACWKPIPPYTGQWVYTGGCRPPNKYGRRWDRADKDSLSQYQRICPRVLESGDWQGPGRPDITPKRH
ncbi:hypothetical protein [Luteimonas sp. e5]